MAVDFVALFVTLPIVILATLVVVMHQFSRRQSGEAAPSIAGHKLLWAVTVVLALLFLMAGFPKLIGVEGAVQKFTDWGYSAQFMMVVGLVEMAGAVLLLFPRLATIATVPLSIVMAGAIYTHIANAEYAMVILPALAFLGLMYVGWERASDARKWASTARDIPVRT